MRFSIIVTPAKAGVHVSLHPPQFYEEKVMGPSLRWGDGAGLWLDALADGDAAVVFQRLRLFRANLFPDP